MTNARIWVLNFHCSLSHSKLQEDAVIFYIFEYIHSPHYGKNGTSDLLGFFVCISGTGVINHFICHIFILAPVWVLFHGF